MQVAAGAFIAQKTAVRCAVPLVDHPEGENAMDRKVSLRRLDAGVVFEDGFSVELTKAPGGAFGTLEKVLAEVAEPAVLERARVLIGVWKRLVRTRALAAPPFKMYRNFRADGKVEHALVGAVEGPRRS
jgi:hypothetical protein